MRKAAVLLTTLLALVTTVAPWASAADSTNDPLVARQWALDQIQAFDAWKHATGKGALVAVVDSGIDLTHPDLRGNIASIGKDFVDGGSADDEFGHGSHIAGIIAAETNNGIGVAGIAPDARLMSVRILDENNGTDSKSVPRGIRWAAEHGADVINVSIGYPIPLYGQYYAAGIKDLQQAVTFAYDKGAVVVFAAGNMYQPLCDEPYKPALCVGATGAFEEKTHYSNFDATTLENYLVAPGGETIVLDCDWTIVSTWLRSKPRSQDPCTPGDGYAAVGGTSMAAPMVSGVAALLVEQGLTNDEIVERILATADDLGTPGEDPVYGAGRVNALTAVSGG